MHADSLFVILAALILVPLGVAKMLAVPDMRRRAAHHGIAVDRYRLIGLAELAGAAGLAVGLRASVIGYLAAAGLLLLLAGALVSHRRSGDEPVKTAPAVFTALVVVGFVITVASGV